MKIKPAEYISVLRIIIFIFRGNWAKVGIMQRSHKPTAAALIATENKVINYV
jgi:hypothetical protein